MITGIYRLADWTIQITSVYEAVHKLCAEYQTNESQQDFSVQTSASDITFEREKSAREDVTEGNIIRNFHDAYLETLAVYRKIAEQMPVYDTVLFHGSCVAVDGEGYLFTAKSGTGKSTHARLWREFLGDKVLMINDDKPLIRITNEGAKVYGTPWDGKHHLSTNTSVPLKSICILERAKENIIRPISMGEAYPMLLQQIYRPINEDAMAKTLSLIDRLVASVSLWRLGCNMDPEAAHISYQAMK